MHKRGSLTFTDIYVMITIDIGERHVTLLLRARKEINGSLHAISFRSGDNTGIDACPPANALPCRSVDDLNFPGLLGQYLGVVKGINNLNKILQG